MKRMSLDPKMNIKEENKDPLNSSPPPLKDNGEQVSHGKKHSNNKRIMPSFIRNIFLPKNDVTLRETIEEYIEEEIFCPDEDETSISKHEKNLISNVLSLRNMSVSDIMVPRADIIAINKNISKEELFNLLSTRQYSRLPVYIDTLDNVVGSIHVKDILASIVRAEELNIDGLTRDLPIISPSMQMLDLLLQMRETKKHMALVIDEFGGIDGLITIEDIVESIVGEIDDEHDPDEDQPEIIINPDGTIIADARVELEDFEKQFGKILTKEERSENDTLGGLIFFIAGRVPARGEVLSHESGIKFEIIEADPRRIKRVYIHNIPAKNR